MTKKVTKTGKELEQRVADAYRAMGARRVEHDVELAGNQIDIYVELETSGRLLHRIAVEAKDRSRSVGIDVLNKFATVVGLLRGKGLIDEGVIISVKGFSKEARNAAYTHGIRLLELADLDVMVAETKQKRISSTVMEAGLEGAVLSALYVHRLSNPDSPHMSFGELYDAIGIPSSDKEKVGEVWHRLFSLRNRGWVDYESPQDGSGGTVVIASAGVREVDDRLQSRLPLTEPESPELPEGTEGREATNEGGVPGLCPATLEDAIQGDPTCAYFFQRRDLLDEIKACFERRASSACHFVVLYGEPMVGKTQVLIRLSEALGDKYVPLRVTSQGLGLSALGDLDAFVYDLAVQLQNKFSKWAGHHGISLRLSDLDKKDFQNGGARRAFYAHWDRLRQHAGNRQPVVMFDEIERLLDHEDRLNPQILTFLDDFACNLENGCIIIAGSERVLHLHNKLLTMLIVRGQSIRVRYYTEETVSSIFSAVQKYFTFEEEVLHYLTALCDGHPRFLSAAYQATRSLGKRRLGENDVEQVLGKFIDSTSPALLELLRRLTSDERAVVWLVSHNVSGLAGGLEYSLRELVDTAGQIPARSRIDYDLGRGVARLAEREWIEWKNREEGSFRFKLGIFPLWVRRYHIPLTPDLDEVRP